MEDVIKQISDLVESAGQQITKAQELADANGLSFEFPAINSWGMGDLTYFGKGTKITRRWNWRFGEGELDYGTWISSSSDEC